MQQYDFWIVYKKDSEMTANYLSRNMAEAITWQPGQILQEKEANPFIKAPR